MAEKRTETIYGRNPVYEVMRAGRRQVYRLLLAEGVEPKGNLERAIRKAGAQRVPIVRVPRSTLDRASSSHQGIGAEVAPYPYVAVIDILEEAGKRGEPPFVLLLDSLQDPQNLGSLLRTAEAAGVHGVVIPGRRGVGVTQSAVSASAGASEHLLIAVENLAQAIERLKHAGVWIVGLENSPEAQPLDTAALSGSLGLVVGSEGEGMRRLVRQACDYLVRLPMRGRVDSLNAAVAGSIALYAAWAARGYPGMEPVSEPGSGFA